MLLATPLLLSLAFLTTLSHAALDPAFVGKWQSVNVQCSDREQEGAMIQGARLSAEMTVKADGSALYQVRGEKPGAKAVDMSFDFKLTSTPSDVQFSHIWYGNVPVPFFTMHASYEKIGQDEVVAHLYDAPCGKGTLDHDFRRVK